MNIEAELFYNNTLIEKDLKIFQLKYKAQEGEFVMIELLCQEEDIEITNINLKKEGGIFFKGTFLEKKQIVEPAMMKLSFIAKPQDFIMPDHAESCFEDVLLNEGELFNVDPVTHGLCCISPFLMKESSMDITDNVFQKSLEVLHIRNKMDNFDVIIHAEWEQKEEGIFDLFPFIEKKFVGSNVMTLTPKTFQYSFPNAGSSLGGIDGSKNGYSVLFKDLKEIPCGRSTKIIVAEKNISIPWKSFKGRYFIQWKTCFLRKEEVKLFFKWCDKGYFIPQSEESQNKITFHVKKNILSGGTFFDAENGRQSILQAAMQSIYKGLQSRFSSCIKFKVPFAMGVSLRIGQTIRILEYVGKVARLDGVNTYADAVMEVWLIPNYQIDINLQKTIVQRIEVMPEEALDLFAHPSKLTDQNFVKNVSVFNDAINQEDFLKKQTIQNLQEAIQKVPTLIEVEFLDLSNKKQLIQLYKMEKKSCIGEIA